MEKNHFKFRIKVIQKEPDVLYDLVPLPAAQGLPSNYILLPGDIDFSELCSLPAKFKAEILYHIANSNNAAYDLTPATEIASYVILARLKNPSYLPAELNPSTWEW